MTVDDEISRIETGKNDIRKFSESRGVSIPASETIDHYTQYLNQIQTGNGENEVFFAEYGVTSFQDVLVAFKAGKNIWLKIRGRRFMPLLEADDAADPQIFTFLLSSGMFLNRVDVGLQNGETHWESTSIEISASDISATVPASGVRKNIQAYLDYLNGKIPKIGGTKGQIATSDGAGGIEWVTAKTWNGEGSY